MSTHVYEKQREERIEGLLVGVEFDSACDFLGWFSMTSTLEWETQPTKKGKLANLSIRSLIASYE